jgi:hypothetical protein
MMAYVLMALMAVVVAINLYRAWRRDQGVDRAVVVRLTTTEQLRPRQAELLT